MVLVRKIGIAIILQYEVIFHVQLKRAGKMRKLGKQRRQEAGNWPAVNDWLVPGILVATQNSWLDNVRRGRETRLMVFFFLFFFYLLCFHSFAESCSSDAKGSPAVPQDCRGQGENRLKKTNVPSHILCIHSNNIITGKTSRTSTCDLDYSILNGVLALLFNTKTPIIGRVLHHLSK